MRNSPTNVSLSSDVAIAHLRALNRIFLVVLSLSLISTASRMDIISVESFTLPMIGNAKLKGDIAFSFAVLIMVFLISVAMNGLYPGFVKSLHSCDPNTRKLISLYPTFFSLHHVAFWIILAILSVGLGLLLLPFRIGIFILWFVAVFTFGGICNVIRGKLSDLLKEG